MSHYCVFVLSPRKPDNVEAYAEEKLEPFSENKEVLPYKSKCWCVNQEAESDAYRLANAQFDIQEIRKQYFEELEVIVAQKTGNKEYNSANAEKWRKAREEAADEISPSLDERMAPRREFLKNTLDEHPLKDKPNKNCEECNGTGKEISTYNPKSKWDWWQIGGRWGGYLLPEYDPAKDPQNVEICWLCSGTGKRNDKLGQEMRQKDPTYTCNGCSGKGKATKWPTAWQTPEEGNVAPVSSILKNIKDGHNLLPFALLKPSGEWVERGEMGWFATVSEEKDNWSEVAEAILKEHKDHWAIVVDCHI